MLHINSKALRAAQLRDTYAPHSTIVDCDREVVVYSVLRNTFPNRAMLIMFGVP